ncbi:hypothetical protein Sjap_020432 [Stephania japonica]|uniref:Flavin-containing monooxygenase n=1 Tax=Stephania japonica TaxID=461633 RepID=A0AAP0F820_9MAGN
MEDIIQCRAQLSLVKQTVGPHWPPVAVYLKNEPLQKVIDYYRKPWARECRSHTRKVPFPFLKTNNIVTVNDNCVGPLYQHVLPPALAPSLSFIGLIWRVILSLKIFCHSIFISCISVFWVCIYTVNVFNGHVIPFPLLELQSKWVAGVLSGRIPLPSQEDMISSVCAFYAKLKDVGVPKHYTHHIGDYQVE